MNRIVVLGTGSGITASTNAEEFPFCVANGLATTLPIERHTDQARHHAFIASSRLKGRGWMESRLVGEKGGGTIGQISSATTDYSIGKWKGRRDVRVPLQFLIESSRARHLTISIQC